MKQDAITHLIFEYVSNNLYQIIAGTFTLLGAIITGTWLICKSWYKREIEYLKNSKESECKILQHKADYLAQKLQDNNSYAKGIVELSKYQLQQNNDDPQMSKQSDIVKSEYEERIAIMKNQYEADIERLRKENESLYNSLKDSKTEKTEMLDRLYVFISYSSDFEINNPVYKEMELCYHELYKRKDEADFYIIYSELSTYITRYILINYYKTIKENTNYRKAVLTNRKNNLNYIIRIIQPFINEDDSDQNLKSKIDNLRKWLNNLNNKDDDTSVGD